MPNDPTLYPSIANPQQQIIQRQGSLEARVAALESKRDPIFTPFLINTGGSVTIPWLGGRLWMNIGGKAGYTPSVAGYRKVGADVNLNGQAVYSDYATVWINSLSDYQQVALPQQSTEFSFAALTGLYGSTPGSSLTLQAFANNSANFCRVSGIFIEWPQA